MGMPFKRKGSLFGKFSRLLFAVVIATVLMHSYALWRLYQVFLAKVAQTASWELAQEIKGDFQPLLSPRLLLSQLEEAAYNFQRRNRTTSIFIAEADGRIVFSSVHGHAGWIPVDPIKTFLSARGYPLLPILGADPEDLARKDRVPFSAAPIAIENRPGYLYLSLHNSFYKTVYQMHGDFTLLVASASLFISVALAATAFGLALIYPLARRFKELTSAVSRFSSGDYGVRVASQRQDEIGLHARAFNNMAEIIENNIAQLKENDALRREFIVNISHDLRTPLGAMLSLLDTMQGKFDRLTRIEQLRFLDRALANCLQLQSLVEDLFELSKLNARMQLADVQIIDLQMLLSAIAERFAAKAEEKKLQVVAGAANLPFVLADRKMIDRAISNLVENAVRYSGRPGKITLAAHRKGETVEVSVADQGAGIPADEIAHIFDRFYRGRSAPRKEQSGSGLGLAITKRIIELHGAAVSVESIEGKGTIFRFTLKAADRPAGSSETL